MEKKYINREYQWYCITFYLYEPVLTENELDFILGILLKITGKVFLYKRF